MLASVSLFIVASLKPVLADTAKTAVQTASGSAHFTHWPKGTSPQEVGKLVAENFVVRSHGNLERPKNPKYIVYSEVCTWYGSLTFAQLTNDRDLLDRLVKRFDPLLTSAESHLIPAAIHVDLSVFGAVPLELYIQNRDTRYLALGQWCADTQWALPNPNLIQGREDQIEPNVDTASLLAQGLSPQTRYWIDDMYMINVLQAQAYRATQNPVYLDRAAREMVSYLDKLQQPNGLFFHAPDAPYFWGRGNGWFAAGFVELLRVLPKNHPQYARIMSGYRTMMSSLLKLQSDDGMWRQLLNRPESWPETSSTGMFTFAFISGVKNGWLDEKTYGPAARKAWLALGTYLNPDGNLREVCEGTGKKNDYEHYMHRARVVGDLHGQAPLLWCASAFLR
ncbi:MAG: glycoside hydrolase family 88 protein [Verrucomicrobia bacterium]|nr:glycoside hydrolase family 88 protein [Verrucomicrobiota bacterium]